MKFATWIINLEKRKIITTKPHPVIPFILGFIFLGLTIFGIKNNPKFVWLYSGLAIFTFIFAIIHWIVVKVVKEKK